MSSFYYVAVGFVVAVTLVWVFFLVKDQWEEHEEKLKREMRDIAREEVLKESNYIKAFMTLEKYKNKPRLAEKEGEHEQGTC